MLRLLVLIGTILTIVPFNRAQFTVGDPPVTGGGGFFPLDEVIEGKCDSPTRFIEDHTTPCSGSGSTPLDQVANVSSGGSFSINPTLRTYNIFCKIGSLTECFSAMTYDANIRDVDKGFECVLQFSPDGAGGSTDRFPTYVQWLKNGKPMKDFAKNLTKSDFEDKDNLLTYSYPLDVGKDTCDNVTFMTHMVTY